MKFEAGYFWPDNDERMIGIHGWCAAQSVEHQERQAKKIVDLCGTRRVAVQAGAHLGHFARTFAKHFERVYTFEPDPQQYECALQNLNKSRNVAITNCALGNGSGQVIFEHHPTHCGKSRIKPELPTTYETAYDFGYDAPRYVQMHALDHFHIRYCDLLQLDVEGFELFALMGAQKLIEECQPVIVLEINECIKRHGLSKLDIDNWLLERNYVAHPHLTVDDYDYVYKPRIKT